MRWLTPTTFYYTTFIINPVLFTSCKKRRGRYYSRTTACLGLKRPLSTPFLRRSRFGRNRGFQFQFQRLITNPCRPLTFPPHPRHKRNSVFVSATKGRLLRVLERPDPRPTETTPFSRVTPPVERPRITFLCRKLYWSMEDNHVDSSGILHPQGVPQLFDTVFRSRPKETGQSRPPEKSQFPVSRTSTHLGGTGPPSDRTIRTRTYSSWTDGSDACVQVHSVWTQKTRDFRPLLG